MLGRTATIVFTLLTAGVRAGELSDFAEQVRPILSKNCFACHGPDAHSREAGLRLDGPGELPLHEIIARITTTDPDLVMPPVDSQRTLTPEQKETLVAWAKAGAPRETHWSFAPSRATPVPQVEEGRWSKHAIDRFVSARWRESGLHGAPRADKRTLIRRVTLDLTGLPPTIEELHAFLADTSEDAYQKLVDRLLSSPRYGEHMTRYWLDLVRFADTNGLHHDHYREMTPYRDWVIRSFNDNLPFDRFITYQLAGDLLPEASVDQLVASGYNRLHLIIDVGTALPEESFNRNVVDQVSALGTAFMGLTLECAVCHDHKYDPISQRDFYQLYAFFNNFDGEPETGKRGTADFRRGLQPPYIELPAPEQKRRLEELDAQIELATRRIERAKSAAAGSVAAVRTGEGVQDLEAVLKQRREERAALIQEIPAAMVMQERESPRQAHVLIRGQYDSPGEPVGRDTPGFLPPLEISGETPSRLDLARWLVAESNPLTGRVAVNRFWQQLFGVGLVKTSEDFGAQGELPSHPRLLDYLAVRFVESGWDVKRLMRTIVLSETYQQSSAAGRQEYAHSPSNRLLTRGSRFRLDAEVIRDSLLQATGRLDLTMYGKSVKPPQPAGLWRSVTMPSSFPREFEPDTAPDIYRRSVYTFWKRGLPPPQLTILDVPTRESCISRRERTNTPLQALLMMNEEQYFLAAMHFGDRLRRMPSRSVADRIRLASETITSHPVSGPELTQFEQAFDSFRDHYQNDPDQLDALVAQSAAAGAPSNPDREAQADLAAWTMVVHSILNLESVKMRE